MSQTALAKCDPNTGGNHETWNIFLLPGLREGGDKWGLGGVSVRTKYIADAAILPPGCYMKTGAYSTVFWVDPSDDMFGIFLTQLQPLNWDLMQYYMVLGTQAVVDGKP